MQIQKLGVLKKIAIAKNWKVYIPPIEYTTDNAAMIGIVGYYKFIHKKFDQFDITPSPRFKFDEYFFNKQLLKSTDEIIFSKDEAKHIIKVLRKNIGDEIMVTNGEGLQWNGSISSIDIKSVKARKVKCNFNFKTKKIFTLLFLIKILPEWNGSLKKQLK